jgi:hypothetical protein
MHILCSTLKYTIQLTQFHNILKFRQTQVVLTLIAWAVSPKLVPIHTLQMSRRCSFLMQLSLTLRCQTTTSNRSTVGFKQGNKTLSNHKSHQMKRKPQRKTLLSNLRHSKLNIKLRCARIWKTVDFASIKIRVHLHTLQTSWKRRLMFQKITKLNFANDTTKICSVLTGADASSCTEKRQRRSNWKRALILVLRQRKK